MNTIIYKKRTIIPVQLSNYIDMIAEEISSVLDPNEDVPVYENTPNTEEIIISLIEAMNDRSFETSSHIKRVSQYSYILSKELALKEAECQKIRLASSLHDIGKIGIPDNILNKPGKLTEEEYSKMKTHTTVGYNLFKDSKKEILVATAIIAKEHHERYDGTGYPHNLKGNDIHLYGRIVAVADVFDALGTERVYKDAWPLDKIIDYMVEQKGKQFDPEIIDILVENLDKILLIKDILDDY